MEEEGAGTALICASVAASEQASCQQDSRRWMGMRESRGYGGVFGL